jgi:hypothetical protein
MTDYGGLLYGLYDRKHSERIKKCIDAGDTFTIPISDADFSPTGFETCLLSFDRTRLAYFCLLKRGRRVATAQRRLALEDIVSLGGLPFGKFSESRFAIVRAFLSKAERGRVFRAAPSVWDAVLKALKTLKPELAKDIDRLERARRTAATSSDGEGFTTMALEKDACGLALEIFGASRSKLLARQEAPREPAPFLQGLQDVALREDPMIQHDAANFPGLKFTRHTQVGAAEFEKGKERLTLLNVNRAPIEETLGVDLIYYQHQYRAYILVQYKRMNADGFGGWAFRPTERQCQKELARMRAFKATNPTMPSVDGTADYRLNAEAFFFKLCKSITFTPMETKLIEGMYIPLDYWELLLKSPKVVGAKKGLRIAYDTVERHLNNQEFVNLVRYGWIGSRVKNTEILTELIGSLLRKKHSVLVGLETTK